MSGGCKTIQKGQKHDPQQRRSTPTLEYSATRVLVGPSCYGGEAMKHSAVVVILLLVAAFSGGIVTAVTAGEPFSGPIQQMEGQIKALNFACHAAPGVCKGSLIVAEQHRGDVPLVHPPRHADQALGAVLDAPRAATWRSH
jgi:hypothetical protein